MLAIKFQNGASIYHHQKPFENMKYLYKTLYETVIANPWVRKGLRLINSKGMTCLLRGLYSSVDFQVYQSIVQIGKKTIYAYGGARTHSLAQQKCMGETLERIAIKLHMKYYNLHTLEPLVHLTRKTL